jgi:hypothetical protein
LFDAELSSTTRGRERREELTIGGSDDASTIVRDLSDFDMPASAGGRSCRRSASAADQMSFLAEPAPIMQDGTTRLYYEMVITNFAGITYAGGGIGERRRGYGKL